MISIENLSIALPNFSVSDVSLHVKKGEFFAIMGPTGSGKTLIMESITGIAPPHTGTISINGTCVSTALPEERNISLVYQDHSLFPHMTVLDNVMFGQRYRGIAKQEGKNIALDLLAMLGLTHAISRKPARLSGGEKQRVAIARALACKPDVLLLDEPLSALDPQFRADFRNVLRKLHQQTGITIVMVTHDFIDALTLAERGAVIHNGKIAQCGTVHEIFNKPATPFIANFVGMTNILPVTYTRTGYALFEGAVTLPCIPSPAHSSELHAAIRPEHIGVRCDNTFPENWVSLKGTLEELDRDGFAWKGTIRCKDQIVTASIDPHSMLADKFSPSMQVAVGFPPSAVHYM